MICEASRKKTAPLRRVQKRVERVLVARLVALCLLLPLFVLQPSAARAQGTVPGLSIGGHIEARGVGVRSRPSWLEGGFGRLALGAESGDDDDTLALGLVHLAVDWQATEKLGAYLHATARAEPSELEGRAGGIVEAYLQLDPAPRRGAIPRLRLGHFLLPTSRENVEVAWSSPYTLTFSALNSWIGEEMRLTGLWAESRFAVAAIDELRVGASLYGGNDASGALLAWRGFAFGDRLTTYGEFLPVPPLDSLAEGGAFAVQTERGTRPFGSDLDDRLGWAGYLRWQRPERTLVQLTHLDSRGDRELHGGEYAWDTELDLLAAELHLGPSWSLVGELMRGTTGMGLRSAGHVDLDFEAAYLLASWNAARFRVTLRWDTFDIVDRDLSVAEINDEDGEAWTLAAFWEPHEDLRLGVELLNVDADRPAAAESGFDPETDARSVLLELRYYLDF